MSSAVRRCCCDLVQESGSRRGAARSRAGQSRDAPHRRAPEHAAHIPGHCPRTARLVRAAERGEESAPLSQVRLGPGWVAPCPALLPNLPGKSCVGSWAGAARAADIRIGSGDKLAGCPYKAIVLS